MKKITPTTVSILLFSFIQTKVQDNNAATIKEFLTGVLPLDNEKLNAHSPIASFNEIAAKKAAKTIVITKDNMDASLKEAKGFKNCIITVGNHTIAKVTDFEKTIQSGSWGVMMPSADGYTQKGTLTNIKDYLNNIIGKPDAQTRTMYLFN